ncbi:cytochrome c [bacterium]|nr:cytochrome c [bacterium]
MRAHINLISLGALLAAGVLFLTACPSGDDAGNNQQAAAPAADPAVSSGSSHSLPPAGAENPCGDAPAAVEDASAIYKTANCTMCHGEDFAGGALAPGLSNIAAEWDKAELTKYIKDPSKYEDSGKRLSHDPKYTIEMPPFAMSDDDLNKLVDWLLTR